MCLWSTEQKTDAKNLKYPIKARDNLITEDAYLQFASCAPPIVLAVVNLSMATGFRRSDALLFNLDNLTDTHYHFVEYKNRKQNKKIKLKLNDHIKKCIDEALAIRPKSDLPHLFIYEKTGTPYFDYDTGAAHLFSSRFTSTQKRTLKKFPEWEMFSIHDSRRFIASKCSTPEEASKKLAHNRVSTTIKHYFRGEREIEI